MLELLGLHARNSMLGTLRIFIGTPRIPCQDSHVRTPYMGGWGGDRISSHLVAPNGGGPCWGPEAKEHEKPKTSQKLIGP